MKVTRVKAVQAHPIPSRVTSPSGPFPQELFRESKINTEYESEVPEDGSNFPIGSTAQNNFKGARVLTCSECNGRVLEHKTGDHTCKED
jgi:hypothetical protein